MTILGSFLRGRQRETSNSPELGLPPRVLTPPRYYPPLDTVQMSPSFNADPTSSGPPAAQSSCTTSINDVPSSVPAAPPLTHRICLVPCIDSNHTFHFEPIDCDLRDGDTPLRIGRYTERSANTSTKLGFKSKVLSRIHAEIWSENGKIYIKDTKSSSGTFLNHFRLSPAGSESAPHQLKVGDIVQLGVDYQGGFLDIYKSVKLRIEVGRGLQEERIENNTETQRLFGPSETQVRTRPFYSFNPHRCDIQRRSHDTSNELSSDHSGTNTHCRESHQGSGSYLPNDVCCLTLMHRINVSVPKADSGPYRYYGSQRTHGSGLRYCRRAADGADSRRSQQSPLL
jgi:pSer/pThr/pTyr-binding forkhead associated (FHA) protein